VVGAGIHVAGQGLGLVVPAMTAALLGSVEASRSGIASGTLNTARQAGSVIGVALFGALAAGSLVSGLRLGLVISIVLSLATVTLSLGIREEPRSQAGRRADRWRRALAPRGR
jgi:MFS transporter, DHA2 family, methylenomycin A resistance protein